MSSVRGARRLGALLIAALLGCSSSKNVDVDIDVLSSELMVQLPRDARVLGVERESGIDDMVRVKVEVSRSAFDHMLPSLPIAPDAFSPRKGRIGADSGFWNPGATPGIRYAQTPIAVGRVLHFAYAETAPDRVVLFIMNHST